MNNDQPIPLGLELAFYRDLAFKFVGDETVEKEIEQLQTSAWQVVGRFDFLRLSTISYLEEAGSLLDQPVGNAIGAGSGIVLIPFEEDRLTDDSQTQMKEFFRAVTSPDHTGKSEMLAILRISLSCVAYELEPSFEGVTSNVCAFKTLLSDFATSQKDSAFPTRYQFFRTLGSPDIVLLATLKNASELFAVDRLSQFARTLPLSAVGNSAKDQPGHAFASIDEVLVFGQLAADFDHNWQNPSAVQGCLVDCQIRVDCGHEAYVFEDLQRLDAIVSRTNDPSPLHYWGAHTIRAQFPSILAYLNAWRAFFSKPKWRTANLIDCSSQIALTTQRPSPEPSLQQLHLDANGLAWALTKELVQTLARIESSICAWADEFLSKAQLKEIAHILRTFRSCFYHHELASVARDLIPFLNQLSFCCCPATFDLWKEYQQSDSFDTERFSEDVRKLIHHLQRAIRNRLEHRSQHADPTIQHTLEHGGSKLVNAYSAMYWLCSELLHGRRKEADAEHCFANGLAVCVAAGVDGRVSCEELFWHFRVFVEDKCCTEQSLSLSSVGATGADATLPKIECGWNSRLLLLEISGKSLFRPEVCFVHCLHETAEFGEWIELKDSAALRCSVNTSLTAATEKFIGEIWLDKSKDSEPAQRIEIDRFLPGFIRYLVLGEKDVARIQTPPAGPLSSFATVTELSWETILASTSPVAFAEHLYDVIPSGLQRDSTWDAYLSQYRRLADPDAAWPADKAQFISYFRENGSENLQLRLDALLETIREIVADTGMWFVVDNIMRENFEIRDPKELARRRVADLNKIFASIVRAHSEFVGESRINAENMENFAIRWGVQLAAVAGDFESSDFSWRAEMIACAKQVSAEVGETIEYFAQHGFDEHVIYFSKEASSLVSQLRKGWQDQPFAAYTPQQDKARQDNVLPYNKFTEPQKLLVKAFLNCWKQPQTFSAIQSELAMLFWSKSIRMVMLRAFEAVGRRTNQN